MFHVEHPKDTGTDSHRRGIGLPGVGLMRNFGGSGRYLYGLFCCVLFSCFTWICVRILINEKKIGERIMLGAGIVFGLLLSALLVLLSVCVVVLAFYGGSTEIEERSCDILWRISGILFGCVFVCVLLGIC